ncbi:MAG: hypothetical protein U1E56_02825 [Bauldia sp.]
MTVSGFCRATCAAFAMLGALALGAHSACAQDRFDLKVLKTVFPPLQATIDALRQGDVKKAREAFADYDSMWNGVEVYINVRDRPGYELVELELQARVTKALDGANPDRNAIIADVQAMATRLNQSIDIIAKAPPLHPLFDDVTRLRIVRAHLREVTPALKAGNLAKARKSFAAFNDNWDSIEDLVKARSADGYIAIERDMIKVENALEAAKPDTDAVIALVSAITTQYNAALAEVNKEAQTKR